MGHVLQRLSEKQPYRVIDKQDFYMDAVLVGNSVKVIKGKQTLITQKHFKLKQVNNICFNIYFNFKQLQNSLTLWSLVGHIRVDACLPKKLTLSFIF